MSRFFYLQGLQKDEGLKGFFCSFSCKLLSFLGGGCTLNEIFCGFKTQRSIHIYGVPIPDFSNSNEL